MKYLSRKEKKDKLNELRRIRDKIDDIVFVDIVDEKKLIKIVKKYLIKVEEYELSTDKKFIKASNNFNKQRERGTLETWDHKQSLALLKLIDEWNKTFFGRIKNFLGLYKCEICGGIPPTKNRSKQKK